MLYVYYICIHIYICIYYIYTLFLVQVCKKVALRSETYCKDQHATEAMPNQHNAIIFTVFVLLQVLSLLALLEVLSMLAVLVLSLLAKKHKGIIFSLFSSCCSSSIRSTLASSTEKVLNLLALLEQTYKY